MAVHTAHYDTGTEPARSQWWHYGILGVALVVLGGFLLANLVAATIASAILFGLALLVVGILQIIHAFWEKGWGGFALSLVIGAFYTVAGGVLVSNPLAASVALTLVFAILLIGSGVFRIVMAFRFWAQSGWLLLLSGIIGILAGLVIYSGWPYTGLWVLGLCLGIDILFHGIWWLAYAWQVRQGH